MSTRTRIAWTIPLAVALAVLLSACTTTEGGQAGASPSASAGAQRVPNVVGMHLDEAIRKLSSAGYANVRYEDATNQRRAVVNQANWVVRGQQPPAGASAGRSGEVTLKVDKPGDATQPAVRAGVVPRVLCLDLQKAQDSLQAAGFLNVTSKDGTGKGRAQLLDRNWLVTKQSARPGSRPSTQTQILLTVVKYGEPTGSSGCKS